MKTTLIIFICTLLSSVSFFGQSFKELLLNKTNVKNRFTLIEEISVRKIVIPFQYNSAITDFERIKILKIPYRNIQKIEYIYSDNRDVAHQEKLNSERIDTLTMMFKHRIKRIYKNIELLTVVQTQQEDKKELFNGFIITVENSSRSNNQLLNKVLTTEPKKKKAIESCFNLDTLNEYGYVLPHVKADYSGYEYKTINKIFNRNSEWKDKLIVLDITGSMTPYIAQYLIWLKLSFNPKETQNFVFFNDGNGFKQKKKPIGETGGLYFTDNKFGYDYVVKTLTKAIVNGNCNYDIQENDIEALIGGIKKFPTSKSIVLIADNNAPPRDFELIKELKKPVKVILCGTNGSNIQEAYLNLAYQTKGSVHTIENDLVDIFKNKEGSKFELFGNRFQIKGGRVVLLDVKKS